MQVPTAKREGGAEVGKTSHEPLGFLSGIFPVSSQRWATVDKVGFAIASTFRRLEYLFWEGVRRKATNVVKTQQRLDEVVEEQVKKNDER